MNPAGIDAAIFPFGALGEPVLVDPTKTRPALMESAVAAIATAIATAAAAVATVAATAAAAAATVAAAAAHAAMVATTVVTAHAAVAASEGTVIRRIVVGGM